MWQLASRGLTRRAAPAQSGLFSGLNPSVYNATDPLPLWVIQIIVIIGMTQLLALVFSRIHQPKVIAEVIGGVLLGPSVMGRIPNFTNTIFPSASMPVLTLTSDIGLILFLFLVGLEIDVRVIKRNARASLSISIAGLVLPLGLGAALAVPIYNVFTDPKVNFGYFVLFVAVAVGITAFPVLCRILTELKLLDTTVGVVVLAAGVGNDVVGWILLALTVALVNAGSGLTALWVLLTAIGYILFLTIPVRLAFRWIARRTGSLETGQPTTLMMTLTLVIVFVSAFFTDIIGIHPIFGGFLSGLIIPHDNGFAIALVEKLEDLVTVLFLPIYFILSGLRTNLGLLNNGITWGYTILICVVSFFAKFLGSSIAAKLCGFNVREAGAVGALMSCKGLVELIALNVGLQAGILDTRTFSMFVLHALVLTFMTTPLVLFFYPAKYRVHADTVRRLSVGSTGASSEDGVKSLAATGDIFKTRFTVVLDRIEQLPAIMTLTQLLQYPSDSPSVEISKDSDAYQISAQPQTPSAALTPALPQHRLSVDALRLVELTDRTSTVLKSQAVETLMRKDPILRVFRTFGHLRRLAVSTTLSVVGWEDYPSHVAEHVRQTASQMVVIPWSSGPSSDEETPKSNAAGPSTRTASPVEGLFSTQGEQTLTAAHSQFIRQVFQETPSDVALFVDRGVQELDDGQEDYHVFLPFFGGPDDRLALSFVVQLCMNSTVSATIVRFRRTASNDLTPCSTTESDVKLKDELISANIPTLHYTTLRDTVYGIRHTQMRLESDTADDLLWAQYTSPSEPEIADALSRISFREEFHSKPLNAVLDSASAAVAQHDDHARLIVVVGRSRLMAVESHDAELRELCAARGASLGSEMPKTLGPVAAAFVAANTNSSLLVLQACR
ncbi:K(+)/H(+) antiporter 1 [Sparassis crispa]|uniref:K(+)/H(+) antiporter 1 n=1 Tax=Sparassis crispa TaxID=139825 RepID=A0A401GCA9_9APHY|nr:K(+)/H(+) antiporter 1 [Sparassis crispa]GBE79781.1 K(+)/H(+) antiporter 1 [Sparassis crispa]